MKTPREKKKNSGDENQKRVLYFSIVFLLLMTIGALMGLFIGKLTGFFALENVTYVAPTLTSMNLSVANDFVYVNITSDEPINMSILEWADQTGLTNYTMSNYSLTTWYLNMTLLTDGNYNYTIWVQNQSLTDNLSYVQTRRKFVTIDNLAPAVNITYPENITYATIALSINYTVNESAQGVWYSLNGAKNISLINITTRHNITLSADGIKNVFAIDLDLDGDMDVISASYTDDRVAWYENNGAETFTEHNITTAADGVYSVYAIDLDSDGDIDVLSASGDDDAVSWYENNGTQGFTRYNISRGNDPNSVFAADVDSNGYIDVLVEDANSVSWWSNDGTQSFTGINISTTRFSEGEVYAIDIDQDGDMDVLSAAYGDKKTAWYENDGAESFTEAFISTEADASLFIRAADMDNDGEIDVVSGGYWSSKLAWYKNDGSESFTTNYISSSTKNVHRINIADMDGDGDNDIVAGYEGSADDILSWFENNGTGKFTEHNISINIGNTQAVYVADIDGDGDKDALGGGAADDTLAWFESNQTNTTITAVEGTNTVFVYTKDRAGNINFTKMVFTADTTAPRITINKPAAPPNNITADTTPELNVSVDETGELWYQLDHNGTNITVCTACNGSELNFTTLTEGFHNVTVWANDSVNNVNSTTLYFTIDTEPPIITINKPFASPANWTNNTPSLNISLNKLGSEIWYERDHNGTNITMCNNCRDVEVTSNSLDEGFHNYTFWANDTAGNLNTTLIFFTVDITPPRITINKPLASPANWTNDNTPALNASIDEIGTIWYQLNYNGTNITACTACTGFEINESVLSDGYHNYTVWANDSTGNKNSSVIYFTVDTVSPVLLLNNPLASPNNLTNDNTPELSANVKFAGEFWYQLDHNGTNISVCTSCKNFSINLSTLADGFHNITVWVNDSASNANSTTRYFTVDTAKPNINITVQNRTYATLSIDLNWISSEGAKGAWYSLNNASNVSMIDITTRHNITNDVVAVWDVSAIDVDKDGDIDAISASETDSTLAWWDNDGTGTFTRNNISTNMTNARNFYAADIDFDGDIDFVGNAFGSDKVSWFKNNGTGFEENVINVVTDDAPADVFAIDLDKDGDIDILTSAYGSNTVAWLENNGSESFTRHNISTGISGSRDIYVIDLDDDGYLDVLTVSITDNTVSWWKNNGTQGFTQNNITANAQAYRPTTVFPVDLDRDGNLDILTNPQDTVNANNAIAWWKNNGTEGFSRHNVTNITVTSAGAASLQGIDMDGDLDIDVVASYDYPTRDRIVWLENNGSQNFTEHNISVVIDNLRPIYAADFNNDGMIDVLSASATENTLMWFESNQTNATLTAVEGTNSVIACTADKAGNINCTTTIFSADVTVPVIGSFTCTSSVTQGETVTCSCSATDNLGTPTVTFTANPATAVTGTFTEICTAQDGANNNATATTTYTVNPSSGGELPPEECENECGGNNARECINEASYRKCGNYDADECLEWSAIENCESGKVCKEGYCIKEKECKPNWICREWSECRFRYDMNRLGNLIERICEDANKCESNTVETQDCTLPGREIESKFEPSPSGGGYIGVYDKLTKNKIAQIEQGERNGVPFVDVDLYTSVEETVSKELVSEVARMPISVETPAVTIKNYARTYLRWVILLGLICALVAYVLPRNSFAPFARRLGQEAKIIIEKQSPAIRQFIQKASEGIKKEITSVKSGAKLKTEIKPAVKILPRLEKPEIKPVITIKKPKKSFFEFLKPRAKTELKIKDEQYKTPQKAQPKPDLLKKIQSQFAELKVPKPEIKPEKIDRKIISIKEQLKRIDEEHKKLKK